MSTIKIKRSSTSGNVPSSLADGEFAINQADGLLFWKDSSGRIRTSDLFTGSVDALASNNLIVNPGMDVDQVHAGALVNLVTGAAPAYIVDQFQAAYTNTGAEFTAQQAPVPGTPSFGLQLPNSLKLISTSAIGALAAGDFAYIATPIEGYRWARLGYGSTNGENLTLGFWHYSDQGGNLSIAIQNGAANRSYVTSVAVNAGLQWVSAVIPPDSAGSLWSNDFTLGAKVFVCYACGSNYQAPAENSWQSGNYYGSALTGNLFNSNGNSACLTGMVLLTGVHELSSMHAPNMIMSFDRALKECQRYYRKSYDYSTLPGTASKFNNSDLLQLTGAASASYTGGGGVEFGEPMRSPPTIYGYSPNSGSVGKAYDALAAQDVAVTVTSVGNKGFQWSATNAAAAAGIKMQLQWVADARF